MYGEPNTKPALIQGRSEIKWKKAFITENKEKH